MKEIVYIDLDRVVVDYDSALKKIDKKVLDKYEKSSHVPGIYSLMDPEDGAIEAVNKIRKKYEVYFLSFAPWENPSAWSDKVIWVQKNFGDWVKKRLILSNRKDLNIGDYLIDDREKNGAKDFQGEFIHFKTEKFPDWNSVLSYLDLE